ncbi:hypothetical protein [Winogradskyella sp.]|uniref:hypothetical protein n=1 Tax=Winogradskyella sp. TaxID=1883156 RepID=UPI003BA8A5C0
MQKKTINALLITLCVVIYGAIFFKAFIKKEVVNTSPTGIDNFVSVDLDMGTTKDSVELFFPKRSPFGEPRKATPLRTEKIVPKKKVSKSPTYSKTIWPSVIYHGFIKNRLSSKRLIAITVNNKMYKIRESETIGDMKIKTVYSDSISVEYNNEVKTFYKKS